MNLKEISRIKGNLQYGWMIFASFIIGTLWIAVVDIGPYPAEACVARYLISITLAALVSVIMYKKPSVKIILKVLLVILSIMLLAVVISALLIKTGVFHVLSIHVIAIVFVALLLICILIMFIRKQVSENLFMAVTVLLIGSAFAVSYPVGTGVSWDDQIHYQRIAQISHADAGDLNAADDLLVKSAYLDTDESTLKHIADGTTEDFERKVNEEYIKRDKSEIPPVEVSDVIVPQYIPEAGTLFLARGLGIEYSHVFIIGRWIGVLLYSLLLYFSLVQLRSGKLIYFLISMIPTVLFLMSNYSYDPWCLGISMFAFAYYLGIMQDEDRKMQTRDIILICILLVLAYLAKPNYFCMILALFFIDRDKLDKGLSKKKYYGIILASCILLVLIMGIPYLVSNSGGNDMRGGDGVDSAAQIGFILREPIRYTKILLKYLSGYWSPMASSNYISAFAYLGTVSRFIGFYIFMLAIIILDKQPEDIGITTAKRRIWTLLLAFGASCLFATIMYIAFTPVASDTVNGCQGRYILPLLVFIGYYISDYRIVAGIRKHISQRTLIITAFVVSASYAYYCIYSVMLYHY